MSTVCSFVFLSVDIFPMSVGAAQPYLLLPNEVIVYRGIMYRKSLQIVHSVYYVNKGQTIHHSIIMSDLNICTMQYDRYKEYTPGTSKTER